MLENRCPLFVARVAEKDLYMFGLLELSVLYSVF